MGIVMMCVENVYVCVWSVWVSVEPFERSILFGTEVDAIPFSVVNQLFILSSISVFTMTLSSSPLQTGLFPSNYVREITS